MSHAEVRHLLVLELLRLEHRPFLRELVAYALYCVNRGDFVGLLEAA